MTHADRHDRARWIASGLSDALITIMIRDATLPPPHAARWYDSSLSTDDIVTFRRSGRQAPDAAFAESLAARGLPTDPAFVAAWVGFDADQILAAIDRGFSSGGQFAPWATTDADITEVERLAELGPTDRFEPSKALDQLRAGRSPDEIAFALESGLKPKRAAAWIERGVPPSIAAAWSQAGFSAGRASAWLEVVDDPEIARQLESIGLDVDAAREQRPETGWSTQTVRRHVAVAAGADEVDEADAWASTTVPIRRLARWVTAGVHPDDAGTWIGRTFRAAEAAVWAAHGFDPDAAGDWRDAGVDVEVAARRRDAGVRPPTAH
jgi:hypothetical protein